MKLVVIGNGFDLYHGLPSKYSDFAKEKDGYLGQISELNKYKLNEICDKKKIQ